MKKTVKRMVTIATSIITMASMFAGITAQAAVTYKTLTYSAGNVDGIVGSSEVTMEKVIETTFDAAAASRLSRKGYTVASWNVPSTGETVALGAQYRMPSTDVTFVANWKEAEYNVSFAGKGGKTAEGKANLTGKATYGTAMELPECEFIYNGYTFAGWKYDNTTYAAGEEFEVPALLSGSKIVFSAVWTEETAEAEEIEETTEEATEAEVEEETTEETTIMETTEIVSEETEEETETTVVEEETEETTEETNFMEIYEYIANEETETTVAEEVEEEETETTVVEEVEETEETTVETEEAEEAEEIEETVVVMFDYNNDGIVDREDAEALRKFMVGSAVEGFEITAENADVNGDGMINVFDYMALSRICG